MLRALQIEGFGLIERAEVEFADGATIFTGETGSGKTMLLGALDFVLGARAGADVVGRSAQKAVVTLEFQPDEPLRATLNDDCFELDCGEAGTVSREMTQSGRSSLRINGRPATAAYVRVIRDSIAELVGQHEAQRLLTPAYHLELLDRFAGESALELRAAVATTYKRVQETAETLVQLTRDERRARERYDDACYALREIEEAAPQPGERERLNERAAFVHNVERIAQALHVASQALAAEESGATNALGVANVALASVAKFDAALGEMAVRASALQSEASELSTTVSRALEAAEYDPRELEALNRRLDIIERLQRKYGPTLEDVTAFATRARAIVEEYEGRDRDVARLQAEASVADRELRAAAAELTACRQKAATALSKRVTAEFADIALASARFNVAIEPLAQIGAQGAERVEFLFSAHAGEPAQPLSRMASGGELSRVLLALVVVLADRRDASAALVFDEIDAGIGGTTATAVGTRIAQLAKRGQVICVTHVAQLAIWADRHYFLDKIDQKRQATIIVRPIANAKEREAEIARMLSGESHEIAVRHARVLLRATKR